MKKTKVTCECGRTTTLEDCHEEHVAGGITHTHFCGHDLVTGRLGEYYGKITDGSCSICMPKEGRE